MSIKLVCCALCGIGGTWCRDTDTHVVVRAIWLDWSRWLRLRPRCGPPTPAPVYPDSPRPTWVGWPAGCPTPGPSSPRSSAAQDDKTHSQDGDGSGGGGCGCHGNRTSHHRERRKSQEETATVIARAAAGRKWSWPRIPTTRTSNLRTVIKVSHPGPGDNTKYQKKKKVQLLFYIQINFKI